MSTHSTYRGAAKQLAKAHVKTEPYIKEIFLFPDKKEKEIRLIEITPHAIPQDEKIVAFYFPPSESQEHQFWLGIAIIRPEDKGLNPPQGWGSWSEAIPLWTAPKRNSVKQRAVRSARYGQ